MAAKAAGESGFAGFGQQALPFLKALGFHQDREWFHANKKLYESDVKRPLAAFVESASLAMAEAGVPLHGSPKASTFRINRDIRFSKNKDPYNQHVSGVLTRNGTKKDTGGVYFHVSPGRTLFASGLWHPDGPMLKAFRETIVARPDDFFALEDDLRSRGLVWGEEGKLVRVPNGFKHVNDETLQDRLRLKSFVVERAIDDEKVVSPDLVTDLVAFAQETLPFMNCVWRATDPVRKSEEDKA